MGEAKNVELSIFFFSVPSLLFLIIEDPLINFEGKNSHYSLENVNEFCDAFCRKRDKIIRISEHIHNMKHNYIILRARSSTFMLSL